MAGENITEALVVFGEGIDPDTATETISFFDEDGNPINFTGLSGFSTILFPSGDITGVTDSAAIAAAQLNLVKDQKQTAKTATLSAQLTGGVSITSLPVNSLPVGVDPGQPLLVNNQYIVLVGYQGAIATSTSITIVPWTPPTTINNGAQVIPSKLGTIRFSEGEFYVADGTTWYGEWWEGVGQYNTRFIRAANGLGSTCIASAGFSALTGNDNANCPRGGGFRNLTIFGNAIPGAGINNQTARPMVKSVKGAYITQSAAQGTTPYYYQITVVTPTGETGGQQHYVSTMTGNANLNTSNNVLHWTAPSGAPTGSTISIYGRTADNPNRPTLLVQGLAIGTTTWSDNGSVTPGTKLAPVVNTSGNTLLALYSWSTRLENIEICCSNGIGLWTEYAWSAEPLWGAGFQTLMALFTNLFIHTNWATGVVWLGPHDSMWEGGCIGPNCQGDWGVMTDTVTISAVSGNSNPAITVSHMPTWLTVGDLITLDLHSSGISNIVGYQGATGSATDVLCLVTAINRTTMTITVKATLTGSYTSGGTVKADEGSNDYNLYVGSSGLSIDKIHVSGGNCHYVVRNDGGLLRWGEGMVVEGATKALFWDAWGGGADINGLFYSGQGSANNHTACRIIKLGHDVDGHTVMWGFTMKANATYQTVGGYLVDFGDATNYPANNHIRFKYAGEQAGCKPELPGYIGNLDWTSSFEAEWSKLDNVMAKLAVPLRPEDRTPWNVLAANAETPAKQLWYGHKAGPPPRYTMPPFIGGMTGGVTTGWGTGKMIAAAIPVYRGDVISRICFKTQDVAAASLTHWWVSLHDFGGTLVDQSSDGGSNPVPAGGVGTLAGQWTFIDVPLPGAPHAVWEDGYFYATLMVAAGTLPNLCGYTPVTAMDGFLFTPSLPLNMIIGTGAYTTTAPGSFWSETRNAAISFMPLFGLH